MENTLIVNKDTFQASTKHQMKLAGKQIDISFSRLICYRRKIANNNFVINFQNL